MEHLQSSPYTHGSSHLRDYVSAPVIADDPLNADTEAPTRQDEVISSIEDADLRQQLRWLQYLERLNAGAWGDHIAVQGLADMLHVDIHIISTINPDMEIHTHIRWCGLGTTSSWSTLGSTSYLCTSHFFNIV